MSMMIMIDDIDDEMMIILMTNVLRTKDQANSLKCNSQIRF